MVQTDLPELQKLSFNDKYEEEVDSLYRILSDLEVVQTLVDYSLTDPSGELCKMQRSDFETANTHYINEMDYICQL